MCIDTKIKTKVNVLAHTHTGTKQPESYETLMQRISKSCSLEIEGYFNKVEQSKLIFDCE